MVLVPTDPAAADAVREPVDEIAEAERRGEAQAMARVRAILLAPEAAGPCLWLAVKLAIDTDLPVDEARAMLAAAAPQPARTGKLH
jgi:hypothetical protein